MTRVGKRLAGNLFGGREHNGLPVDARLRKYNSPLADNVICPSRGGTTETGKGDYGTDA